MPLQNPIRQRTTSFHILIFWTQLQIQGLHINPETGQGSQKRKDHGGDSPRPENESKVSAFLGRSGRGGGSPWCVFKKYFQGRLPATDKKPRLDPKVRFLTASGSFTYLDSVLIRPLKLKRLLLRRPLPMVSGTQLVRYKVFPHP